MMNHNSFDHFDDNLSHLFYIDNMVANKVPNDYDHHHYHHLLLPQHYPHPQLKNQHYNSNNSNNSNNSRYHHYLCFILYTMIFGCIFNIIT